jgi:hypothetical protein
MTVEATAAARRNAANRAHMAQNERKGRERDQAEVEVPERIVL